MLDYWSGRPGSNRRHPAWEAGVLPLNYSRSLRGKSTIIYQFPSLFFSAQSFPTPDFHAGGEPAATFGTPRHRRSLSWLSSPVNFNTVPLVECSWVPPCRFPVCCRSKQSVTMVHWPDASSHQRRYPRLLPPTLPNLLH